MTKVLITGITGFLGPYIAREMLEHGYQVIGISRHKPQEEIKGVCYLQGSVDNFDFINSVMEKIDFVIHSAAKSTIWGDYRDFYNVNVLGTKSIIEACEFHQIKRLVYVSSPSIYSKFMHQYSVKEDDLLGKSLNHYIETKKLAKVLKMSLKYLPSFLETLLEKANLTREEIHWFVPHQASPGIPLAMKALKIPEQKVINLFDEYGNMVSASVLFALVEAMERGKIVSGQKICLLGTAAGLTINGLIMQL